MSDQTALQRAAKLIASSRKLAVLSGAGISKESGVPTFRDAQSGLWAKYDPQRLATPVAFLNDPALVWSWYMFRHQMISDVKPNPGHYAIAELERLVPEVVILTQNVDGLHRQTGSSDVVELHGNIRRYKCFANCRGVPTIIDLNTIEHDDKYPPPCPHCGAHVWPDVVWFGEMLPPDILQRAQQVSASCDIMLVVGTSGVVQPAASIPYMAKQSGATIIDINPEPDGITPIADIFLQGPSGQMLPQVVEAIKKFRA